MDRRCGWFWAPPLLDSQWVTSRCGWFLAGVLPAFVVACLGIGLAVFALALPSSTAHFLLWIAAAVMLVATVLQPGLALNTLPAAGLLSAGATRAAASRATAAQETDSCPALVARRRTLTKRWPRAS